MSKVVILGRRTVNYDKFVEAVKNAKRYTEVCDNLGFNNTVGTTKQIIKDRIKELGLSTLHFEYKYNKSDKYYQAHRGKDYKIDSVNQPYFDIMESKIDSNSFNTYRCSIGNFLEHICEQDFATITPKQLEDYCGEKKNQMAHIRSMMITAVKENINDAVEKVSKEMLIWLI